MSQRDRPEPRNPRETAEKPDSYHLIKNGSGVILAIGKCTEAQRPHPPHLKDGTFCPGLSFARQFRVPQEMDWDSDYAQISRLNGGADGTVLLLSSDRKDDLPRRWLCIDRLSSGKKTSNVVPTPGIDEE